MSSVPPRRHHADWIRSARRQVDAADVRSQAAAGTQRLSGQASATDFPSEFFPGYTLQRVVHAGGQGVVHAAVQKSTGRMVALKVLRASAFASQSEQSRFVREVQVLAALRHPNIVTIYDSGTVGPVLYLVMDFV